jgi:hypothetical protein
LILNPLSGPPPPLQAFAPKPVHALFAAHRHGRDAPFPTKMTLTAFGRDKNRRGAPGIFERTGVTPAERRLRRPATPGRRIRDAQTSANRLNPHRQRRRRHPPPTAIYLHGAPFWRPFRRRSAIGEPPTEPRVAAAATKFRSHGAAFVGSSRVSTPQRQKGVSAWNLRFRKCDAQASVKLSRAQ